MKFSDRATGACNATYGASIKKNSYAHTCSINDPSIFKDCILLFPIKPCNTLRVCTALVKIA